MPVPSLKKVKNRARRKIPEITISDLSESSLVYVENVSVS